MEKELRFILHPHDVPNTHMEQYNNTPKGTVLNNCFKNHNYSNLGNVPNAGKMQRCLFLASCCSRCCCCCSWWLCSRSFIQTTPCRNISDWLEQFVASTLGIASLDNTYTILESDTSQSWSGFLTLLTSLKMWFRPYYCFRTFSNMHSLGTLECTRIPGHYHTSSARR